MLEIVEKFITLSGEAPIIGYPVYLIRFSGCNLDCHYCDTDYKNEINFKLTKTELINDIYKQLKDYPALKVLLTGGEPLLPERLPDIRYIIKKMKNVEFYIETNGSILIKSNLLRNCHYVMDWKSPSSGEQERFCVNNIKILKQKDCIKFVVGEDDLNWLRIAIVKIKKINKSIPLYVSPQHGNIDLETLSGFIIDNKLSVNFSIQLHKIIWKNKNRGI